MRKTSAKASAPAKIILFGEHFVVYDSHAIMAAINRRIHVAVFLNKTQTINITSNLGIIGSYTDSKFNLIKGGKNTKEILDPVYKSAIDVLSEREQNLGIDINVVSEVPYGVGLGSSAACCVATVAAVDSLFHKPDKQWVCSKAVESERLVHKDSSGGDCYISTFGGLIYYSKIKGFKTIETTRDLSLIIVNTGIKHRTGDLVSSVKKFKNDNTSLFKDLSSYADNICQDALTAINIGDEKKLGKLMNENYTLLQQIRVSHKKHDQIAKICFKNGALGVKPTGAGGGGSMIVLIPKEDKIKLTSEIERNSYECIPVKIDYDGLVVY
ncbi:MAG TPA: mevalonate kinase [Nitrososphaeraceae archaeon]